MSPKKKVHNTGKSRQRRRPNPLHDRLVKLLMRPEGATMHDTWNAGFYFPAKVALKLAARRGLKTKVVKVKGELTRYIARRNITRRR